MFSKLFKAVTAVAVSIGIAGTMLASASVDQFTPVTDGSYLNYMSFNLRYDTKSNPLMATSVRGPHLMQLIQSYDVDSVGFQEADDNWMLYLRGAMKDAGYSYVGVGRDNGKDDTTKDSQANEFSPIFYRSDKYTVVESGTFWLSPQPDLVLDNHQPSWDAANTRICTYAVLKNKETGEEYAHFNTHLDFQGTTAMLNGTRIILSRILDVEERYQGIGVVLTGDFNSTRFDNTNPYYIPAVYNMVTSRMDDSRSLAQKIIVDGATFNGYQNPADWENGQASSNDKPAVDTTTSPIDFLFLTKGMFDVKYYTVVNDTFTFDYNGTTYHNHPVSDHYGVYCSVKLNGNTYSADNFDEGKLVVYPAKEYLGGEAAPSDTELQKLENLTNLAETATPSSNLACSDSRGISNVVQPGSSGTQLSASTGNVFWEVTLKLTKTSRIQAVTFGTSGTVQNIPKTVELYVSDDQVNWKKVGNTLIRQAAPHSTTYFLPDSPVEARYVKLVMPDAFNNATLENVSVYGQEGGSNKVEPEDIQVISGPSMGGKEGVEKLFDGDATTKMYSGSAPTIEWKISEPVTLSKYSFTSANDNAQFTNRYPTGWKLYGSTDGLNWDELDSRSNQSFVDQNYQQFPSYPIQTPGSYSHYKISFTGLEGSNGMQFSEMTLYKAGEEVVPAAKPLITSVAQNGETTRVNFLPTSDADSYTLHYGTSAGVYSKTISGITTTPVLLDSLAKGTAYYFELVPVNAAGEGPASNEVQFLTAPDPDASTPSEPSSSSEVTPSEPSSSSEVTPSEPSSSSEVTPSEPSSSSEVTPSEPSSSSEVTPSEPSSSSEVTPSEPSSSSEVTPSEPSSSSEVTPSEPSSSSEETPSEPSSSSEETPAEPSSSSEVTPAEPSSSSEVTPAQPSSSSQTGTGLVSSSSQAASGSNPNTSDANHAMAVAIVLCGVAAGSLILLKRKQ